MCGEETAIVQHVLVEKVEKNALQSAVDSFSVILDSYQEILTRAAANKNVFPIVSVSKPREFPLVASIPVT